MNCYQINFIIYSNFQINMLKVAVQLNWMGKGETIGFSKLIFKEILISESYFLMYLRNLIGRLEIL